MNRIEDMISNHIPMSITFSTTKKVMKNILIVVYMITTSTLLLGQSEDKLNKIFNHYWSCAMNEQHPEYILLYEKEISLSFLIQKLNSNNVIDRNKAIAIIGGLGDITIIKEQIIPLINKRDITTIAAAVAVIKKYPSKEGSLALIQLLNEIEIKNGKDLLLISKIGSALKYHSNKSVLLMLKKYISEITAKNISPQLVNKLQKIYRVIKMYNSGEKERMKIISEELNHGLLGYEWAMFKIEKSKDLRYIPIMKKLMDKNKNNEKTAIVKNNLGGKLSKEEKEIVRNYEYKQNKIKIQNELLVKKYKANTLKFESFDHSHIEDF